MSPPSADSPPTTLQPAVATPPPPASIWRLPLHIKARVLRGASGLAYRSQARQPPVVAYPDEYFTVDSTLGYYKAKNAIGVQVYLPDDYAVRTDTTANQDQVQDQGVGKAGTNLQKTGGESVIGDGVGNEDETRRSGNKASGRIGIINVHGGGFTIGSATDDTRWCRFLNSELDGAVVFSIEHRLAPEYPFPTPVEDVADGILAIIARCEQYGVDPSSIYLSGFSAGANLIIAAWTLLAEPSTSYYHYDLSPSYSSSSSVNTTGKTTTIDAVQSIRGLIMFYPVLDWTLTREEKLASTTTADPALPKFLTDLFDQSYIHPPIPRSSRTDPRLSPGRISDSILQRLPPVHLIICERDTLAAEARRFAQRLEQAGKEVVRREVKDAKHGWDKMPGQRPDSVMVEYAAAAESIKAFGRQSG